MQRTLTVLALLSLVASPMVIADVDPTNPPADAVLAPLGDDPAAIRATLELPAATWYNDKDGDKVFDSLMQRFAADPLGTRPVIVTFVDGTDVDVAMEEVRSVAGAVAPRHVYHHVLGFAADLDLGQVLAIADLDMVRQVEWSQPGAPELDTATVNFNVDTVQESLGITGDRDGDLAGITGNDTIVAIMDTGFDGEHVDLQGKFLRFIDWTDDGKEVEPYDSGSHGTHVASIVGGRGVGDPDYTGVAPGAAFVGFQISGGDTKANAIASMDWIIEHQDEVPVRVSTISFGFGSTSDGTDALELAMDRAWEAGVVPFKSNGNSGPEKGTVTIPGGARGIISTGSLHDAGDGGFRISSFSSRGPTADGRVKPDITAPGSNIMAADVDSGDGYTSKSGTSMASPFAAGVAALMFSADPSITNDDVRRIMQETAWDWGMEGDDVDWGAGRIDALRAVQQVLLEKAIRENAPYETIMELDVQPPGIAWHAHGTLSADADTTTFDVESGDMALGVTVLADGLDSGVTEVGALRALTVQLIPPSGDGDMSVDLAATPTRQHTFGVNAPETGTWTLRAGGFNGEVQVLYDAVGQLPENEVDPILPLDEAGYTELLGVDSEGGPDQVEAPIPVLVAVAALGAAVALRRRH